MVNTCVICKSDYKSDYRGWYDNLVPPVCCGGCYYIWLEINITEHTYGTMVSRGEPYPRNLVNADRRSSYEDRFEQWLKESFISYIYEPYSFHLGTKLYVPDFLINIATYVEVKGLWNSGDKTKVKDFLKTGRHLHIVDEAFLRSLNHERGGTRKKRTL